MSLINFFGLQGIGGTKGNTPLNVNFHSCGFTSSGFFVGNFRFSSKVLTNVTVNYTLNFSLGEPSQTDSVIITTGNASVGIVSTILATPLTQCTSITVNSITPNPYTGSDPGQFYIYSNFVGVC